MEKNKTQICSKCKNEKDTTLFAVDKSKKSGRKSICKSCDTERVKKYRNAKNNKNIDITEQYKILEERLRDPKKINIEDFDRISTNLRSLILCISEGKTNKFSICSDSLGEVSSCSQLFLMRKKQVMLRPEEISISQVENK
ncbi:MAG: hypothetical protein WC755_06185 [Candidatus Woesearchaeota archaeon]|jgi:hypothetical protein